MSKPNKRIVKLAYVLGCAVRVGDMTRVKRGLPEGSFDVERIAMLLNQVAEEEGDIYALGKVSAEELLEVVELIGFKCEDMMFREVLK